MRTNSLLLVALLTLAGFGAGMIIGGRLGSSRPATIPAASTGAGAPGGRLPRLNPRPRIGGSGTAEASRESASVAEIEAGLHKAMRMGGGRSSKALNELIQKA